MKGKGSEWNRWDLHFHTPSSHDYGDKNVTPSDIVEKMVENEVSAFAITDHHVIDVELYEDLKSLGNAKGVTVLPGIEFLSDARGKDPIHFIGIFSETSDVEYIWGQIQHKTAISEVRGEGKKVDEVYCDLDETIDLVKELGGVVTIHSGVKHGSVENITHSLPHSAAQKKEIANKVDIFELGKESDQEGYVKYVFPALKKVIPMIICSDNHNINKYILKQKLWIKGSPDFEGLKYALNEPEERFYIGEEPQVLKRVRDNKTKYIKSLRIKNDGKIDPDNIWFDDIEIPLNSELVTIIGNKGSGKSALSDVMALCCDGEHSEDYLFLHKTRFKKKGLADRFSAEVTFESGVVTDSKALDSDIDSTQESLVRYLPQSYFEKVCNEIGKVEAFRDEIEKVVFQYVPKIKRLSKNSFHELINFKKESIEREIHHFVEAIAESNNKIIDLEDKLSPDYKKSLESKKKLKEEELIAHIQGKPDLKGNPSEELDTPEKKREKSVLKDWELKRDNLLVEIEEVKSSIGERMLSIENLNIIRRDLKSKVDDVSKFLSENKDKAVQLGIDLDLIVSVNLDFKTIDERIVYLEEANQKSKADLIIHDDSGIKTYDSFNLASQLEKCRLEISAIQSKFTGRQKEYQEYLNASEIWEKDKAKIEGDKNTVDTLAYIKHSLDSLDNEIPKQLGLLREQRLNNALEIFKRKAEIKAFYDEIKAEIDSQLETSKVTNLSIASQFYTSSNFKNSILRNIKQNRMGSFYGAEEGASILQESLISVTDWNEEESVKEFLQNIIEYLELDKRAGQDNKTFIGDLVKDRKELYRFLFSLEYLEPHYDLQQSGKSLEQLSPGEKGALLLVFYLVLDKEDKPLIIDQPEDNLDNNSVAKVLVPFIREAKKKRQIIIVTHNPNLAVVSDSEQVIMC